MGILNRTPMGVLVIVLGTISVIAWIVLDGTVPLVISIVTGALIALKATLGREQATSSE